VGNDWMMVMMVVVLFGPLPAAWAGNSTENGNGCWQARGNACHPLLLDSECARYQARLKSLPVGLERSRVQAEESALIRYREDACDCTRRAEAVVISPDGRRERYRF
jgi:hypothetical protein